MTVAAYIALGSNLGHRQTALRSALAHIGRLPGTQITQVSTWLRTAPVGGPPGQGEYLNGAIAVRTKLPPQDLMTHLLAIEKELGRDRTRELHHGPRTMDLDLLLYGGQVINTATLIVPHPRMHERRFVLEPLAEIASDIVHPVLHQTIGELLSRLPAADKAVLRKDP